MGVRANQWICDRDQGRSFADKNGLRGHPPKVIWVRIGNCTTQEMEDLFREHQEVINAFEKDQTIGLLELL
jgi:predicted nuclease of predicted toxin-antitoxin system